MMSVPKEDWGFLNEKAFEAALQASVPERLPDKMAAVTPWKRAMGRVLAGTALTALGTNLWGLNYLLPGIGLVLMLLGFRAPVAGGDRGLSWGHTDGGQRSGVRPEGRLLPEQRLQPAVHNRGRGKADGRACRLDDLPPLSLEHGSALPWDSRHTALPVYQSDELWSAAGEVAGRVLYDRDGETFRAPYHSLEADTSPYGYQGIYGQRDIFGTFSLSTAAQHGRGYVVYAADEIPHAEYRNVPDSRFNYSYPYRFLQYPAKTALENRMSDHGAFRTVWSDLRYGPEVTPPVIKKNDQRNDPPAKAGGSF